MQLSKNSERKKIWFITPSEVLTNPYLEKLPTVMVGRLNNSKLELFNTLEVDTTPWTLHSNSESIISFLSELENKNQLILFHDFPKRLNRFIKDVGLNAKALSKNHIYIDLTKKEFLNEV
jgi:hypothetical protein